MKTLIQSLAAQPIAAKDNGHGWPLLRLGFRPFYLAAALFALLAVPAWVLVFLGHAGWTPELPPTLWHAHEMVFGFAAAVIVGFLMTAGKAWTGLQTPRGTALAVLVLVWLGARVALFAAPYPVFAALDLLLLPIVAVVLVRLLLRAGNRRNLPLAGLLGLLTLANLVFHLSVLGVLDIAPVRALYAALALIVLIECVIAGRVIPAFTMSATPGLRLKIDPQMEKVTAIASVAALACWVFAPTAVLSAPLLALAAVMQLARLAAWQPWCTRSRPILWILHLSYAWIPVGFLLLAASLLGWVAMSAGIHALAVGATGGLIIGMVTRTARGHTGRPLLASPLEVAAYSLVMLAAVLRVVVPVLAPQLLVASVVTAALAWSLAFVFYLGRYTPWLLQARADGKDG
ncbi:NnrS family protein [Comamonadaceae bacterium G21597-S1]|nr:NnrS family protein [Comamonadaceae bacterium G21597-S1]